MSALPAPVLRFGGVAPGQPYHVALIPVTHEPRDTVMRHSHADFHELMYVTSGTGEHRVGGRTIALRRGDLVLVRPHDAHTINATGPEGVHFVNVAFPSRQWSAFTDLVDPDSAARWDRASLPIVANDVTLGSHFDHLVRLSARPTALDLVRLWTAILPALAASGGSTANPRPPWLVAVRSAVASEEALREGLPHLLRVAHVSHGYLDRCMMKHYGQTPVQFLTERRLAHGAMLLATTAEPVGTIATRSGFASQSYFARVFSRHEGCSPRQYRERARRAVVPAGRRRRSVD